MQCYVSFLKYFDYSGLRLESGRCGIIFVGCSATNPVLASVCDYDLANLPSHSLLFSDSQKFDNKTPSSPV